LFELNDEINSDKKDEKNQPKRRSILKMFITSYMIDFYWLNIFSVILITVIVPAIIIGEVIGIFDINFLNIKLNTSNLRSHLYLVFYSSIAYFAILWFALRKLSDYSDWYRAITGKENTE